MLIKSIITTTIQPMKNDNPGPLPPHLRYPPSFRVPGAPDDMPVVLGVEGLETT